MHKKKYYYICEQPNEILCSWRQSDYRYTLVQVINSTFKPKKNTIKKPYVGSNDATADATMLRIVFEKNVYLRVIVTMLNIEGKI